MSHDHHRHDHDKGFMANVHWLLKIHKFWQADTNRAIVDMVDPQPGESLLDVGAGMGPATVLAAARGASVVAVPHCVAGVVAVEGRCQCQTWQLVDVV